MIKIWISFSGYVCKCYDDYDPSTDAKYDLLFVVDTNINDEYWKDYKRFMTTIIQSRPIDREHVRVALLTYANDVRYFRIFPPSFTY